MLPVVLHFVSPEKAKVVGFHVALEQPLTMALRPYSFGNCSIASVVICKMGIIIGPIS